MRGRTRITIGIVATVALLLAIVLIGVIVLTQTDFGRERARRLVLGQLAGSVNGTVEIGRLGGNLLEGVTLSELSIADTTGAKFLEADTLELRYSFRSLLSRRIHLSDVRLVHPTIVLDKPAGGEWNFSRLFPGDTMLANTTARGFGSWLRIEDLTVYDGRLMVRNEWTPADTLEGAARDRAIAAALSDSSRLHVVPVAGGYQTIQEFLDVDARIPLLRLADPDSTDVVVEVASLSTVAFPFRPPAARVRDLSGRFVVSDDSLRFQDVRVEFPESRFFAEGAYATGTGDLRATLRTQPVVLGDLRWIAPTLPDSGGGALELAVATNGPQTRVVARDLDLRLKEARLTGRVEATVGDTVLLGPTELRFTGVDTRLAERFVPGARIPVDGVLNGHLALTGSDVDLSVDAELVFIERGGGRSRVMANGRIGIGEGIRVRDLQLRFDPLQVDLARAFTPDLPVGGTITGSAVVTGSPATQVRIDIDLVHRAITGTSRLVGDTRLTFGEPLRFDVDLGLRPVALRTVGRFVPGVGLYGSAPGSLRAEGTMEDLNVALELAVNGGGSFEARGSLDLASAQQSYDLETRFVHFDADRVFAWAPQTVLTGTLTARGVGTDPAAMHAVVAADLADLRPDSARVEAARVRVRIADGLATIEHGKMGLASASAEIAGSFGLAGGRKGELSYTIQVDSLSDFAGYIPADTVNPADTTRDSHAVGSDTALASAPLAGSVRLAGVVVGSLEGFDLRGTGELNDVVVVGHRVAKGRIHYAWLDALTAEGSLEADAALDSLRAGGLAFDSMTARVRHDEADGNGIADLAVYQNEGHEYRVRSRYNLAPERREIRLDSLRLRLNDTRWTLSESGAVRWRGQGVEVDRIELRDGKGGRMFVDGRVPIEGAGDFELAIENLQIGDFVALLPDTIEASGLLSVHATAEGTLADPRVRGDLRLADFAHGGGRIPMLDATFDYADTELALRAELRNDSRLLLVAEGTLPVDLSFASAVEERLLDRAMRFDVRLDQVQLDSLPPFTEAITGLRGRVEGTVAVRGTPRVPEVEGAIHLDGGAMDLSQPGIELREVSAALTIREDALVLDSLVARSDGGQIRAAGTLDIRTPAEPGFDLTFQARDAKVLDNEQGRLVVDSDLTMEGPFDRARVTGNIDVLEGVIYIPEPEKPVIDLDDPLVIAVIDTTRVGPGVLPGPNPLLDNLEVDVDVQISRNTWVRNSDANIELYTPPDGALSLQLDQSQRTFTLEGSIQMDNGEYTYSGRRFEVSSGSIIFLGTPEFNPLLQILARHEVPQPRGEALVILITIGGTLAEPRIELGSNAQPPLTQTDLISYLAFGRSSSSLLVQGGSGVSDDGAGSGGLGALATQKLAGVALGALMDEAIKDLEAGGLNEFGLDVFRISPAELPEELGLDEGGNVFRSTELEAGKYLTPRIFVAGQGRPTSAWPGIRFEYRTPDGFVWTTTWEPRYLPSEATFDLDTEAQQTRVLGSFLHWEWRY